MITLDTWFQFVHHKGTARETRLLITLQLISQFSFILPALTVCPIGSCTTPKQITGFITFKVTYKTQN